MFESGLAECSVLIDTWWNVNNIPYIVKGVWVTVLIDTWWNVNGIEKFIDFAKEAF